MVRRTHCYADGGKIVKDHLADGGRPKVGPADPATRRKLLNQRLTETEPLRTLGPSVSPDASSATPSGMGVSPNTMRLLKNRGKQIDKATEKAGG
jgi:hypothetical protein